MVGPGSTSPAAVLLGLQHSAGNAAVARQLAIQRSSASDRAHPGVLELQRCGPTPCDCSDDERADFAAKHPEQKMDEQDAVGPESVQTVVQRREVTDGTFDAPHKVSLGELRLLPGIKPKRHDFIPEKRVKKPLANGSFEVAGIPVGYELTTDAQIRSGVGFQSGPAMLTDIELIAHGAEADRLRSRPTLIPGLPLGGGPPPRPRGELEGMARLRLDAVARLDASAKATLSGGVNAFSKAVSVGAYGGFGGSAKASARLSVDNLVFLSWKDGAISLRSDTIPGFWLAFDLEFAISAEAGVYVELRVPEIPVFTSLYNEVESWPGWTRALESEHSWPPGFGLHSFVEADDRHAGFCVWEAPSEAELQSALDSTFGHAARNEVIPARLRYMGGQSADDYVPGWSQGGAE